MSTIISVNPSMALVAAVAAIVAGIAAFAIRNRKWA